MGSTKQSMLEPSYETLKEYSEYVSISEVVHKMLSRRVEHNLSVSDIAWLLEAADMVSEDRAVEAAADREYQDHMTSKND